MDFKAATDVLLECGVSIAQMAEAAGVSTNSILRARMETGQRRSPPKDWKRVTGELADRHALTLQRKARRLIDLAAEMADA